MGKNGKSTKHRKTGQFLALPGGSAAGAAAPLSYGEERNAFGYATARAMLGHLRAMLAHLGAMLAHLGAMLAHLVAILAHLRGYVGPVWGYVGPSWGDVGPS